MQIIILAIFSLLLSGCFAQPPAPKPLNLSPAGVSVEGTLVGKLDSIQLQTALTELAKQKNVWPQNAAFDSQGEITAEQSGRILDIQATADRVMTASADSQVEAVYTELRPPISRERLGAASKIGGYETEILDDNPDRVQNIALTANLLNNAILEPGQEFSFNRITGEPTPERGFRNAVILQNGQKSQGVGGGMCQVSSTLYNAALNAGLRVVERHAHSQPVNYVPRGRDATTYTDKDFRFVNTTRHLLIVRVLRLGAAVKADIWALPNS